METQVFGAFRGRKRGAGVEEAVKAPKQAPAPVQAPAPAAKKRRGSTQPKIKQALQRAAASPRVAEAGGSDGIAARLLLSEAEEQPSRGADAAHGRAGGLDLGRADADAAAAPGTQPQEEQCTTTHGGKLSAWTAPLATTHTAVDAAAGLSFEHEALDISDEDACDDEEEDGAEPSALSALEANISLNMRIMESCDRVRLACVPGSAKALMATRQRDSFAAQVVALARYLTPEGMSNDDEEADAAAATAGVAHG